MVGDAILGDKTSDKGSFSGDKPGVEPPMPGYSIGMPPGYQHFSRMGRYAVAVAAVTGGRR